MKIFTILRNLVKGIANAKTYTDDTFGQMGDYVVEHGTNGNWKYRKWASGSFEAMTVVSLYSSGSSGLELFADSAINSRFGVNDSTEQNTIVTAVNANGATSSAHVEGTTHQASRWYVVLNQGITGYISVGVMVTYFAS